MAEGQDFAHDTLYRALNQPLASFFELSLELCKAMGGLDRGYLILDDVLIQRYRSYEVLLLPSSKQGELQPRPFR
jgi:putative transposase